MAKRLKMKVSWHEQYKRLKAGNIGAVRENDCVVPSSKKKASGGVPRSNDCNLKLSEHNRYSVICMELDVAVMHPFKSHDEARAYFTVESIIAKYGSCRYKQANLSLCAEWFILNRYNTL